MRGRRDGPMKVKTILPALEVVLAAFGGHGTRSRLDESAPPAEEDMPAAVPVTPPATPVGPRD
jgi:hypothetical protein